MGRFIGEGPLGFKAGDPNLYEYVLIIRRITAILTANVHGASLGNRRRIRSASKKALKATTVALEDGTLLKTLSPTIFSITYTPSEVLKIPAVGKNVTLLSSWIYRAIISLLKSKRKQWKVS